MSGTRNLPKNTTPPNSPKGTPHKNLGGGGGPGNGPIDFTSMLGNLLGKSSTQRMLPTSLADQIASPDTALANTLGQQIDQLPKAKTQALKNLSHWFGQVQSAESNGAQADQKLATAGANAAVSNSNGIMASIGGAANPGAAQIGAMGTNDANTLSAIGANDASLANELAPIFKASEASAKDTRSQQYDNQRTQLQQQQAQALGQADAARAQALMQILGADNSARQTNFSNRSGLLNTLAGLQISGMNAASNAQYKNIENALHVSEINKNNAKSALSGLAGMSFTDRRDVANALNGMLMDPNTGQLKAGMSWPAALQAVRGYLKQVGLNPLGRNVVNQFVAPALHNAGINFANPNAIYQP